jgi:mercuric reductase
MRLARSIDTRTAEANQMTDYRMPVAGMTCGDCERHVVEALNEAGASRAEANFRRGEASFQIPASVDPTQIAAALAKTRYEPGAPEPPGPEPASHDGRNGPSNGSDRYDLAIVGSGGGAFAAAVVATERGARAVMIERGTLGGTCVNIGCVPSKTQLRAAETFWRAGQSPVPGHQHARTRG